MKEEIASANKATPPPARLRTASKIKDSPRPEDGNGVSPGPKARSRSVVAETNNIQRARRSLGMNRLKAGEDTAAQKGKEMEERRLVGGPGNRAVEQFARLPRRLDHSSKRIEDDPDGKRKELQQKLDMSENLVQELQSEISVLKSQVEKLQSLNSELVSQNRRFKEDLATAEAKISTLSTRDQEESTVVEVQPPKFRDVQKLIASRLELFKVKETTKAGTIGKMHPPTPKPVTAAVEIQPNGLMNGPPPPPPPPLPRKAPAKAATMQKAPSLVQFYHSLTKHNEKKGATRNGNSSSPSVVNPHSSIVGEIQNRSAHLLAIRQDIETKGDFINNLIQRVQSAAYTDIEDVLTFVEWLDRELSSLADERAVLKHFKWPERKADAMREAAFEYRDIKQLHTEILSYDDDGSMPCEVALRKISNLLDKLERSIDRLFKLRDRTMPSYGDCKIPTDWMLDSGMVSKMKLASVKLAKLYMKRVSMEIESMRLPEKESTQEALLLQSVRFAYRAHQVIQAFCSLS
eukprot:TRINITY_DN2039_c1_g1_i11.p1 TRINITY_DN2039_c1_g1~~TRINITY_DN2039_c1_g1_i11.p1  ORF type:complete len:519 (+),score=144.97 TRINITY_DN2039_c1_g1_i11:240-1796(+)